MRKTNRRAEWIALIAQTIALSAIIYGVSYGVWTFLEAASKHAGSL